MQFSRTEHVFQIWGSRFCSVQRVRFRVFDGMLFRDSNQIREECSFVAMVVTNVLEDGGFHV